MALTPGTRLGHYDVTALLGEGGMGQVWQGTDTQLNRQVALKILPDAFAADPDRLARFTREAQILASLNHPNIAQIHGIEESEGTRALVLELVEGPTLADRIAKGPIPLDEALPIAKQIAEALEAAHEAGVIHRDLKPANIKVREDGTVKVLDFGLAKAFQPDGSDPNMSMSPTISLTAAATQMGMVIGTAAYMSPEQAKGKPVDKRADVWAFGTVLYEMLTGAKPFTGKDVSDTLAAVLRIEADLDALPEATPPRLRQVLKACLQKEPKDRVRDVGDVLLAMDGVFETTVVASSETATVPPLQLWQRPVPLVIGVLALLVATSLAIWSLTRQPDTPADLMRFAIVAPDTAPFGLSRATRDLAISPDGTYIIYKRAASGVTGPELNLRPIDQLQGTPLRGTEDGQGPFVSPDGEWVGFTSNDGSTLLRVSMFGGPPVMLCESPNQILGTTWSADGQIIFGTRDAGLFRVAAGGGDPEALTTLHAEPGGSGHRWPSLLPGGHAVLFVTTTSGGSGLTTGRLSVLALDTREVIPLGLDGTSPHYVSTGHVVYAVEDGSVRAVPFDPERLEVIGNVVTLIDGVSIKSSGAANFSVSDAGRLVYVAGEGITDQLTLVWVDRQGRTELLDMELRDYLRPRLSPDGTQVAVDITSDGNLDIWVAGLERGTLSRLTVDGSNEAPIWTPDGTHVAFASTRPGSPDSDIYWAPADRSGDAEPLLIRDNNQIPYSWSPDARLLAFSEMHPATGRDIWVLPMDGEPQPFLVTSFSERAPAFSPSGRWLAYVSDESRRDEVYVQPYPGPGPRAQVSVNGGREPVWSADGTELFFRSLDGTDMMAVAVEIEPVFAAESPQLLFQGRYASAPVFRLFVDLSTAI